MLQQRVDLMVNRARLCRVIVQGGAVGGFDRKYTKNRAQHRLKRDAIGTDQAPGMFGGRIIAIDKGNLIAMPHRTQRMQQVRSQKRGNPDQHIGRPIEFRPIPDLGRVF